MSTPESPDDPAVQKGAGRTIQLDQFLKWKGLVFSGGEAKIRVQSGDVTVNGEVETRRSKKLQPGDKVAIDGAEHVVELGPEPLV